MVKPGLPMRCRGCGMVRDKSTTAPRCLFHVPLPCRVAVKKCKGPLEMTEEPLEGPETAQDARQSQGPQDKGGPENVQPGATVAHKDEGIEISEK